MSRSSDFSGDDGRTDRLLYPCACARGVISNQWLWKPSLFVTIRVCKRIYSDWFLVSMLILMWLEASATQTTHVRLTWPIGFCSVWLMTNVYIQIPNNEKYMHVTRHCWCIVVYRTWEISASYPFHVWEEWTGTIHKNYTCRPRTLANPVVVQWYWST